MKTSNAKPRLDHSLITNLGAKASVTRTDRAIIAARWFGRVRLKGFDDCSGLCAELDELFQRPSFEGMRSLPSGLLV